MFDTKDNDKNIIWKLYYIKIDFKDVFLRNKLQKVFNIQENIWKKTF